MMRTQKTKKKNSSSWTFSQRFIFKNFSLFLHLHSLSNPIRNFLSKCIHYYVRSTYFVNTPGVVDRIADPNPTIPED